MAPTHLFQPKQSFIVAMGRIAVALGRLGLTPNMLTYISLLPAIASAVAAATGAFFWASGLLLVSGLCDLFDGALARATNATTAYGALLDSTIDRLADAAPLLGLTAFFAPFGWFAVIPGFAMIGAYTISYVRARAESLGTKLPGLWMRRSDRLIILMVILLLGKIHIPGVSIPAPLIVLGVTIAGLLNVLAFVAALAAARNQFRSARQPLS